MTPEEINALLDALIENFRTFITEELQKHYKAGETISSGEIHYLLKLFEDNEMVKMFNEDKIPQDKFRVFLRKYLRLWFELFAEKITEAGGKIVVADNLSDLPTDGSANIAIVGGDLYYWDGTKWRKACECVPGKIPSFDNLSELPTDGSVTVAIVGDDLYYWDGEKWVKVVNEKELNDAISNVYSDIANYINNVLGSHSFKDKGKTYHDTVLEIVNAIPPMNEGDRYLLNVVDDAVSPAQTIKEVETLQSAITPSSKTTLPRPGNIIAKNGVVLVGRFILRNNICTDVGYDLPQLVEYNGNVYGVGDKKLLKFNFNTYSYDVIAGVAFPELATFKNRLHLFDGKLWFNEGTVNNIVWSYIDGSGQVTHGTPFEVPKIGYFDDTANYFDTSVVEYQGKLYIIGRSGLWALNAGETTPTHINNTVFDSAKDVGNGSGSAVVFDGKLWANVGDGIVSWNGSSTTEYQGDGGILLNWDGELFAFKGGNQVSRKLQGNEFTDFTSFQLFTNPFVWDGLLYYLGGYLHNDPLALRTIDKSGNTNLVFTGLGGGKPDSDGSLIVVKFPTGQAVVERISYKTIGGSSGNSIEIKIVGMDENGQYDEPFEEGHRVVVKDSPTGFSREYGIRDGELMDTDGDDSWTTRVENLETDMSAAEGNIAGLQTEVNSLKSITVIRGNVDTYADLLGINTAGMRTGDSYIVEQDENHDDNSAIYTWDGTGWNFTHLWKISLELKYGTYAVSAASFTFNKFAAKNDTGEEFDVLEVSFSGNCNVNIAAASGKSGDTRIMIFNIAAGQTVNLSFGFANKLIDGAELTLTTGVHVVSLIRASVPVINIAPYES